MLPLFHVFAMTTVLTGAVQSGFEMILLPRFDLRQLLRTIERTRPTIFPAVPTIYGAINAAAERQRRDLSSIKMCISGGAPLPADMRERFERLTGCKLREGYGLTEASPVLTCNPTRGRVKDGSVGLPLPGPRSRSMTRRCRDASSDPISEAKSARAGRKSWWGIRAARRKRRPC